MDALSHAFDELRYRYDFSLTILLSSNNPLMTIYEQVPVPCSAAMPFFARGCSIVTALWLCRLRLEIVSARTPPI